MTAGSTPRGPVILAEPVALGARAGPQPAAVRPARDQPRPAPGDLGPPRRLLRGGGPRGGAGVIVTEEASVHALDWPYERAPLATDCGPGWAAVARACRAEGAVVAGRRSGHAGGRASSAYSQRALWAPSRVADVVSREVPKEMEAGGRSPRVVDGFGAAAAGRRRRRPRRRRGQRRPALASCASSSPGSPTSAATATADRPGSASPREVLARGAGGGRSPSGCSALRLCCDELAPWAGVTPEVAAAVAAAAGAARRLPGRGAGLDLLRPTPPPRTRTCRPASTSELCPPRRLGAGGDVAAGRGPGLDRRPGARPRRRWPTASADVVEMTRAQIADPDLGATVARRPTPTGSGPASCCNQRVPGARQPQPDRQLRRRADAGHEASSRRPASRSSAHPATSLVVGGGPAGLELARVAAGAGTGVRARRARRPRSAASSATGRRGRGPRLAGRRGRRGWWRSAPARACAVDLGAEVGRRRTSQAWRRTAAGPSCSAPAAGDPDDAALRRGRRRRRRPTARRCARALAGGPPGRGPVVVWDPVGGPVGVSVAEQLAAGGAGHAGHARPDRRHAAGADRRPRRRRTSGSSRPGSPSSCAATPAAPWRPGRRRWRTASPARAHGRLPPPSSTRAPAARRRPVAATGGRLARAGDAVAPRTVHEAVLEGRRAARARRAARHPRRRGPPLMPASTAVPPPVQPAAPRAR